MKKDNNTENVSKGFFKKIWYSIDKIEKYSELAAEGFGKALKYLIILVILLAIASSFATVFRTSKHIQEIGSYINENAPEFEYKDNYLSITSEEAIITDSEEFGKIIADTNDKTEEQVNEYIDSIKEQENAVIILKDKIILKQSGVNENIVYKYEELFKEINMSEFNRETLVKSLQSTNMIPIYLNLFLMIFIYAFMIQLINTVFYIVFISIFGYLISMILRLKLKYIAILNMAIYSITLPTLLYIVYLVVNAFIDYNIRYFEVMYMLVANIYMIASLFILKTELNKKQGEVQKVLEVEKEVKEELKKQEENNEVNKEKEKNNKEKEKNNKEKEEKEEKEDNKDNGETPEESNA